MAAVLTSPGAIVFPDGKVESWQSEGVTEYSGTMVIWGSPFPGEELLEIINQKEKKDEALNAIRFWIRASVTLEDFSGGKEVPYPGPRGALIVSKEHGYPLGTVFFPPARLVKRTLDAEGESAVLEAERWIHPDLKGKESISFSAGAMLYKVFSGKAPFGRDASEPVIIDSKSIKHIPPEDMLRMDIREGVFTPLHLAAPGLDPELAELTVSAMGRIPKNKEEKQRPAPEKLSGLIGAPFSKPVSSWTKTLSGEELLKIQTEHEQYNKKKALTVKTRRFIIRNTTIIAIAVIAVIVSIFIIRGAVQRQAELPTTKGMTPVEVAETYYGAFGTLDHVLMEACVSGKAGKSDIDMVINLYVISRVRQAYEINSSSFMSAEEWIEAGSPLTESTVFGITDLHIKTISTGNENTRLEAAYTLWVPGSYTRDDDTAAEDIILPPGSMINKDDLELSLVKGAWRITGIGRTSAPAPKN
jgi:hypothetical protein